MYLETKLMEELYSKGVFSCDLTLEPNAENYLIRIFGSNKYIVIDHVDHLPEQLSVKFPSLA